MRLRAPALALLSVLIISVFVPPLAQAAPRKATIAFQGTYRGTASMPSTGRPMMEKIVAVGSASLLGASTLRSTATSVPPNPGGCPIDAYRQRWRPLDDCRRSW